MNKLGLFGIGLDTYWPQFDGLLENLKGYQNEIKNKIERYGVEVADAAAHVRLSIDKSFSLQLFVVFKLLVIRVFEQESKKR